MSIEYCYYCNRHVDTDTDAEHFDCADQYDCIEHEQDYEDENPN